MLREIFVRGWVMIVNFTLLAYSIATMFRDAFSLETQQKYQLNLLLHHWSWQTWIAVFAVVNFLVVFRGAGLAITKRENEKKNLVGKLEEIEKAKPRIRLGDYPGGICIANISQTYGEWRSESVPFLSVHFVNDPIGPYPSAKANDVRATINYYRCSDGKHILSVDGRWSDSSQPSALNPLVSKTHLLPVTFGIGEAHSLDIAYRDVQTGQYFAWNNDNYNYPFFRYPHHLLEGPKFRVDIRLLGEWVDEHFSFEFKATEDGFAEVTMRQMLPL